MMALVASVPAARAQSGVVDDAAPDRLDEEGGRGPMPVDLRSADDGDDEREEEASPVRVQIQPDEAPEIRFSWELGMGAESCPSEDALRDAVAARLGYFPFTRDADRTLRASVTRMGDRLIGTIRLEDATGELIGERTLEGEAGDCHELSRALQLAIAIAIDPTVITRPTPPPAEPAPPPPPERPREPVSGSVDVRPATVIEVRNTDRPRSPTIPEPVEGDPAFVGPVAPPPDRVMLPDDGVRYGGPRFQLSTWSGLTFATGVAPAPTFGFSVAGLGVRYRFASVMAELRHDLGQSAPTADGKAGVWASLTSLTAFGCVHSGWMYGCGSAATGMYAMGAIGVVNVQNAFRPYLAVGGRAGADLPLLAFLGKFWSLWKLRLHVDAAVPMPLWRWRLRYSTPRNDVLWEVPPVAVVVGAALVLSLPP
jgi:hypothetical protein